MVLCIENGQSLPPWAHFVGRVKKHQVYPHFGRLLRTLLGGASDFALSRARQRFRPHRTLFGGARRGHGGTEMWVRTRLKTCPTFGYGRRPRERFHLYQASRTNVSSTCRRCGYNDPHSSRVCFAPSKPDDCHCSQRFDLCGRTRIGLDLGWIPRVVSFRQLSGARTNHVFSTRNLS